MYVPIIMGSDKDIPYVNKIRDELLKFGIKSQYRICSAHKSGSYLLNMLQKYEYDENVKCLVTVAGRSNALSAFVDGHISKPVISNPPLNNGNIHNLFSSTSMPSGVSPLVILGASNCALAVLKILSVYNDILSEYILDYQQTNRNKLRIMDITNKYNISLNDYDVIKYNKTYNKNKEILNETFDFLRNGKVRDLYDYSNNKLLISATDRLTAFDRQLCIIPYKGSVLNNISVWWFNNTDHLVPNHFLQKISDTDILVKKCQPILLEFVVRGYITGSSKTSLWTNYNNGVREYCGHVFPEGLVKNQKLERNLVTPTTKGETDELISENEIVKRGILTQEEWNTCSQYALKLFDYGQRIASKKGLILVDTKYEFGYHNGRIILIDEIHTPDSSRYWFKHSYKERFNKELEPESIDKEIIRKWVKKKYNPYNLEEEIEIPIDMRELVMNRYIQLHEIITGKELI